LICTSTVVLLVSAPVMMSLIAPEGS